MTPRQQKPQSVPLAKVIATAIERERSGKDWTQTQLADEMKRVGFKSWTRATVSEVEGHGRGRSVSMAELLGLANIFGTSLANLLHDPLNNQPIEIAPGGQTVKDFPELIDLVVSRDVVRELVDSVTAASIRKEEKRLREVVRERLEQIAEDLIGQGNYVKQMSETAIFGVEVES